MLCVSVSPTASAEDAVADELTALLHEFLAGASSSDPSVHERFWASELIYTSSNGTRTDKPSIIEAVSAAGDGGTDGPTTVYTAEDIQVNVYGETAVVAFRLIGTQQGDDAQVTQYFNTGTFIRRQDAWQAVAWQATRIPKESE